MKEAALHKSVLPHANVDFLSARHDNHDPCLTPYTQIHSPLPPSIPLCPWMGLAIIRPLTCVFIPWNAHQKGPLKRERYREVKILHSVCVCARTCTCKQYLCSQHAKTRRWVCCVFIWRAVEGSRRVRKKFCLFAFSNIYSNISQAILISATPDPHRITSNSRLRLIIAVFCLPFRQML